MDLVLQVDDYGVEYLPVRKHHLQNFSTFVENIREKGFHIGRGLLKLRLHEDDRKNESCVHDILCHLPKLFEATTTKYVKISRKNEQKVTSFKYNPDVQVTFRASVNEHVYQYEKIDCTPDERDQFVTMACDPASYRNHQVNCCSQLLNSKDLHDLRKHLFAMLEECSPFTEEIRINYERWQKTQAEGQKLNHPQIQKPSVVYGAGIQIEPPVFICEGFSLSKLNTILDLLEEKFDGIAYPYYYIGNKHTFFPWHVEDGATYSINYCFAGAPKLWFGYSPNKFDPMDRIVSGLKISKYHSSCRAGLATHKALMADPQTFKDSHDFQYDMVLQEPGDFIITFPFGLHSGFNLGTNLAVAANFADLPWIEVGMHALQCVCYADQVHMDLTPIINKFKPELLETYLLGTTSALPLCNEGKSNDRKENNISVITKRTLFCPKCSSSFKENKMSRLKSHIVKRHSAEAVQLCRQVDLQYPPFKAKTLAGQTCKACSKFIRGSSTHLRLHMDKVHPLFRK